MRQLRSTSFLALSLTLIASLATGGQVAWARVGMRPADVPGPAVELSAGGEGSPLSVANAFRLLEGELLPLEPGLFADAADGQWHEHSLLTAALVASGVVDPRAIDGYKKQVDQLADELHKSGKMSGPPANQAQALFEFMHRRILHGGYQLDSTDLSLVLDEGRFNCVSASVLFNCLAARFGLRAGGLEFPGHAMSRLILPHGTLDVETTCPGWFHLMDDPDKQAELVERTIGFRPQDGSAKTERREVSDVELVATIYYNRGVDLLAEERFAEALAANAKALRLDPSNTTAHGNLLATINNWAIDLDGAGHPAEAIGLLRQGIALDPSYETFRVNYVHVYSQWVEEYCRLERFHEALDLLVRAADDGIEAAYFRQARLDLCRRWARACLAAGQTDQAFAVFDEAKRIHDSLQAVLEAELAEVNGQALDLVNEGRLAEAVALFDRARARQPDSSLLAENHRATVMRWALGAFESGDYPEGIRRTTHGSAPGQLHPTLIDNVRYGYYHWISRLVAQGHDVDARRVAQKALADPFLAGQVEGVIPSFSRN